MIWTGFFGFLKMQQTAIGLVLVALSLLLLSDKPAFSEGRVYEGSEDKAHCTLWDTQRLRWPQTSMGREKTKCRRKAVPPTTISKVCRLKKVGKDAETGEKLCIYSGQGRGDAEVTVPISPCLNCQRTYSCKKDD